MKGSMCTYRPTLTVKSTMYTVVMYRLTLPIDFREQQTSFIGKIDRHNICRRIGSRSCPKGQLSSRSGRGFLLARKEDVGHNMML